MKLKQPEHLFTSADVQKNGKHHNFLYLKLVADHDPYNWQQLRVSLCSEERLSYQRHAIKYLLKLAHVSIIVVITIEPPTLRCKQLHI